MTIRNFLPGFGMRTVLALAVAAVVVVASLLSVGSPASAQTPPSDGDVIHSATMTVAMTERSPTRVQGKSMPYNIGSITDHRFWQPGPNTHRVTHTDAELNMVGPRKLTCFSLITAIGTSVLVLEHGDSTLKSLDDNELECHDGFTSAGATYNFAHASHCHANIPALHARLHLTHGTLRRPYRA